MDVDLAGLWARALTTRRLVRAPVALYRCGLGLLLGPRLVMVTHRGRTSGLRRFVVLEVVDRPAPDVVVVASGFGESSQWYRNLRADPRCLVSTGLRTNAAADAELLDADASRAAVDGYATEHPRAWAQLRAAIVRATGDDDPSVPVVRLHLRR